MNCPIRKSHRALWSLSCATECRRIVPCGRGQFSGALCVPDGFDMLATCERGPDLYTGTTFASFQSVGTIPILNDKLITCERGFIRKEAAAFRRGALGFHGLRVWPILAIGFRVFPEKHAGFRVLDIGRVTGFAIF